MWEHTQIQRRQRLLFFFWTCSTLSKFLYHCITLTRCQSSHITNCIRCEWLNIPYKINVASVEVIPTFFSYCPIIVPTLASMFQVSVPVGNTDHTSLVVGVTTLVTCGATIYIIIALFRWDWLFLMMAFRLNIFFSGKSPRQSRTSQNQHHLSCQRQK